MSPEYEFPVPTHDWAVPAKVIASIWSMLAVTTIFISLRIYCRAIRTKCLWWDDYLLVGGWLFLLTSTALLSHIWRLGYTTISFDRDNWFVLSVVADVLHKFALGLGKTSFALTLMRFIKGWMRYLIIAVISVMNILFLTHAVLVWRGSCDTPTPYTFTTCWDRSNIAYVNMIVATFSAVSDLILAILAVNVIMGLQMEHREKIGVAFAMCMGVLAGSVAIIEAVQSLTIKDVSDPKFARSVAVLTIWIEAEPNATMVAASIPVLRILIRDVKKSFRTSRGAGGYSRSNEQSKFGASILSRGNQTAREKTVDQDNGSERSILAQSDEYYGGIKQTREVVIDYDAQNKMYPIENNHVVELQDRDQSRTWRNFSR